MKNHGYPATQNNPFSFTPISNVSPLSDVTAICPKRIESFVFARLAMQVQKLFFNLLEQNGRRVTKVYTTRRSPYSPNILSADVNALVFVKLFEFT